MKIKLLRLGEVPAVNLEGIEYRVAPVWVEATLTYGYIAASSNDKTYRYRISELLSSMEELSDALENGFFTATAVDRRAREIISALLDQGVAEEVDTDSSAERRRSEWQTLFR